jgi:chemotaxis protein histidine kinase CheA
MSGSPEPLLDLSEILDLYKEDARRMVEKMRAAVERWSEVASGGSAQYDLRKLSHQLRGSGRTYGFRDVSRISRAIESIMQKIEKRALPADRRVSQSVKMKIERLAAIFAR